MRVSVIAPPSWPLVSDGSGYYSICPHCHALDVIAPTVSSSSLRVPLALPLAAWVAIPPAGFNLSAGSPVRSQPAYLLIIYLLRAYGPVNRAGPPQGVWLHQILHKVECNTRHARFTNVKHVNVIRRLVPSVFVSFIKRQIKLGDAGIIIADLNFQADVHS